MVYREGEVNVHLSHVVIEDVFSREKVEYLCLADGAQIRLDSLVSVNGVPLRRHC